MPLLIFQLDYDTRFGFPNELVIVATAAALGAATLARKHAESHATQLLNNPRSQEGSGRASLVLLGGVSVIALMGSALAIGREASSYSEPDSVTENAPLTLVSSNLHVDRTSTIF